MKFERQPVSSTRADNPWEISWIPAYRRFIARVTLLRINLADKHRLRASLARLTFAMQLDELTTHNFLLFSNVDVL